MGIELTLKRSNVIQKSRIKMLIERICTKIMLGKNIKCIACGSRVTAELQNVFDTRFGIEEAWDICWCPACGLEQTYPVSTPEEIKNLYETYYNFGGEKGTLYTRLRAYFFSSVFYRFWLAIDGDVSFHLEKGLGRLLDIGCNEGRGLCIYKKNWFAVQGLESNEQAAAEARKRGYNVYTGPLEKFQPEEPYDVVVLSNVLEHSLAPKKMLSHVRRILKPGGQVWISCPNNRSWLRYLFGRYWINWHVPFHITHFSKHTLTSLLEKTGFKIQKLKQESPALWVAHSLIVRLFAKQGQPTKQLRNPLLVATLMLVIRALFFPILWFGNRIGRGDCLVIIAKKSD